MYRHSFAWLLAAILPLLGRPADLSQPMENVGEFLDPSVPFHWGSLDLRNTAGSPADNLAPRALRLPLDHGFWVAFDPDLLRVAGLWEGDFQGKGSMAKASYVLPGRKADAGQKSLEGPSGLMWAATSRLPGWSAGDASFTDPRPRVSDPNEAGRGPLPANYGRWLGVHRIADQIALAYEIGGVGILESWEALDEHTVVRHLEIDGARSKALALNLVDLAPGLSWIETAKGVRTQPSGFEGAELMIGATVDGKSASVERRVGRLILRIDPGSNPTRVTTTWKRETVSVEGPSIAVPSPHPGMRERLRDGGETLWPALLSSRVIRSQDPSAYVIDDILLPMPNPWGRNVRPTAMTFLPNGTAVVATFDGDIWLGYGMGTNAPMIQWERFASGFAEPMGIAARGDEVFVYSRAGLTRLWDYNDDREADFYENFCDLPIQSAETREFPMDLELRPDGGFYLAKGGIHSGGEAAQNGTILSVSADGRTCEVVADGLREPFTGLDPASGLLTASDQQGNAVPATPIYPIRPGGYYGFHWARHGDEVREIAKPITWIPHIADNSGASQFWVRSPAMGPLDGTLLHLSYGRPALFRVMIQETGHGSQGGVVQLSTDVSIPILQATTNPQDGAVYLCGLQIYGSNARKIAGIGRLRYRGEPDPELTGLGAFAEGIRLRFNAPLDPESATDIENFEVQRWNYRRTDKYGSPHFKLDGSEGQDRLGISDIWLSPDEQTVFLILPDMKPAMQFSVSWDIETQTRETLAQVAYLTAHTVEPVSEPSGALTQEFLQTALAKPGRLSQQDDTLVSVSRGQKIAQNYGCIACHSIDGATLGKTGPTWLGLYNAERPLANGGSVRADEDYLRRSIIRPDADRVQGYQAGMPSYTGILKEAEIDSLLAYIKTLTAAE